jgi:hypothetical protein
MKKFRFYLAISALLLAFCAAFASQPSFTYYEWREAISQCVAHSYYIDECTPGHPHNPPCTIMIGGDIILLRKI